MEGSTLPTLNISQCVTLKLSSSNYLLWKTQVESFLSSQKLLGFVTGSELRPSTTRVVKDGETQKEEANPDFDLWIQKDQLVKAWIYGSLSEDALRAVYGLQTAQDVWFCLGKKYNRISATRKLDLQRKLQNTTKNQKTISEVSE